jgi:hypothetical protein
MAGGHVIRKGAVVSLGGLADALAAPRAQLLPRVEEVAPRVVPGN